MTGVELRAERAVAGGDSLARLPDGRVALVRGAVPGETVVAEIVSAKRDFVRAATVEVLDASPHRVTAPCPELARGCGGCDWQHVDPAEQLRLKASIVADALRRTARIDHVDVVPGGRTDPFGYRTSLRLAAGADGRLGLRAAASHRSVALRSCAVAHPDLASLIGAVRAHGCREVSMRVGSSSGERTILADRAGARLDGVPSDVGVGPAAVVHESVGSVRLRVSAASFFQSGPQAAELLAAEVGRAAAGAPAGPMLDAYGGVGLFAATVASARAGAGDHARPVAVVESSPSACADAAVNLANLDAVVECATVESWTPRPFALVVADPARRGLGAAAAERLAATGAARMVLVACDPVSFARDAALLRGHGYDLVTATALDLFPNTSHVEVVGRFDRAGAGAATRVPGR